MIICLWPILVYGSQITSVKWKQFLFWKFSHKYEYEQDEESKEQNVGIILQKQLYRLVPVFAHETVTTKHNILSRIHGGIQFCVITNYHAILVNTYFIKANKIHLLKKHNLRRMPSRTNKPKMLYNCISVTRLNFVKS